MRALASGVVLALAACVPATAETEPRGAVAMRMDPSAASRGEAITTSDGWSITVETFVLYVSVSAQPAEASLDVVGGGSVLFNGSRREDLVVVGVPQGQAAGLISFSWYSGSSDGISSTADDIRDVRPEIVERFGQPPSRGFANDHQLVIGPSLVVVAHAQKGDRTLVLDLGLRAAPGRRAEPVVIVANALTPAVVPLAVEALFTNQDGAVVFDDIAVADTNGDGVLAPEELERAEGRCRTCNAWPFGEGGTPSGKPSIFDMLEERTDRVIGLPRMPPYNEIDVSGTSASLAPG